MVRLGVLLIVLSCIVAASQVVAKETMTTANATTKATSKPITKPTSKATTLATKATAKSTPKPANTTTKATSKPITKPTSKATTLTTKATAKSTPKPANTTTKATSKPTTKPTSKATTLTTKATAKSTPKPANVTTTATKKPTTNSTIAPTTNSTIPPTTNSTIAPTTNSTIAPTTNSTMTPTNSTTNPPTEPITTPTPTTPYPHHFKYSLENEDNSTCMMIEGEIQFLVSFYDKNAKKMKTAKMFLPSGATVSGSCANSTDSTAMVSMSFDSVEFTWMFNVESENKWSSMNMTFNATNENHLLVNASGDVFGAVSSESNVKLFSGSKNHSYQCMTEESISLGGNVTVQFKKIHVQPFSVAGGQFNQADVCKKSSDKSSTNNIVPIAVGCALAGLIVIVLIAYLIGRRKTKERADNCSSGMKPNKQDSLVPIIVGCSLAGLIVIVLIAYLLGRRKAPRGYQNI